MMSAFGVEHVGKAFTRAAFARLYPVGEHNIPLRHLSRITDGARRHPANVAAVARSMKQEGLHHPPVAVIYNGRAHLINGHHRVEAARKLGRKKMKVRVQAADYRADQDPSLATPWRSPRPDQVRHGDIRPMVTDMLAESRNAHRAGGPIAL